MTRPLISLGHLISFCWGTEQVAFPTWKPTILDYQARLRKLPQQSSFSFHFCLQIGFGKCLKAENQRDALGHVLIDLVKSSKEQATLTNILRFYNQFSQNFRLKKHTIYLPNYYSRQFYQAFPESIRKIIIFSDCNTCVLTIKPVSHILGFSYGSTLHLGTSSCFCSGSS